MSVSSSIKPKAKKGTTVNKTDGYFGILRNIIFGKNLTKEEKAVLAICKRQKDIEKAELKADWQIVFGEEAPKKKKDIYSIKDITLRKLWMEPNFLYETITKFNSDECYHPIEKYYLQWQPPGSTFKISIPLHDRKLQESVLNFFKDLITI